MRLLAAGVFMLLWPVNVPAESSWLTLLTGCLGAGLLLAAALVMCREEEERP